MRPRSAKTPVNRGYNASRGKLPSAEAVYAIVCEMAPEARRALFEKLADSWQEIPEAIVILKPEVYEHVYESLTSKAEYFDHATAMVNRLGPMVQSPRNAARHEKIRDYLTRGFTFPKIYELMCEEHGGLMTVGKGKRARPVQLDTMIKEYKRWLKATSES
jgi:hypothetical protein